MTVIAETLSKAQRNALENRGKHVGELKRVLEDDFEQCGNDEELIETLFDIRTAKKLPEIKSSSSSRMIRVLAQRGAANTQG